MNLEDWIGYGFIFLFVIVLIGGGYAIYKDSREPKFSLNKSEWECTSFTTRLETSNMIVGKVIIPQTRNVRVCVQWSRK